MKVLILGLPRTGTQSLADALTQLGVTPIYHMREVGKNKHQALWIKAMEAKFEGKGEPFGREQFEEILAGFEGLADYPAAIFPAELIAAYPEAAVILSTRSEESWNKSMMSTLVHYQLSRPVDEDPVSMGSMAAKYHKHCWGDDFAKNGTAHFYAHNQIVRDAAKDRKFLEYEVGSGWEPICNFLGVDVPSTPYPRSDDWLGYKKKTEEDAKQKQLSE